MHICNIGSGSSGSSIDSFSNIFQVHWKNLQRSFSIYTTTKPSLCVFYFAPKKIYGIFMVNTWRNMLEFVASSREHDVGSGKWWRREKSTHKRMHTDMASALNGSLTNLRMRRPTHTRTHIMEKCKRKINVQKNSANFRFLLFIVSLTPALFLPNSMPFDGAQK